MHILVSSVLPHFLRQVGGRRDRGESEVKEEQQLREVT